MQTSASHTLQRHKSLKFQLSISQITFTPINVSFP